MVTGPEVSLARAWMKKQNNGFHPQMTLFEGKYSAWTKSKTSFQESLYEKRILRAQKFKCAKEIVLVGNLI
jgi:hypothetical protein